MACRLGGPFAISIALTVGKLVLRVQRDHPGGAKSAMIEYETFEVSVLRHLLERVGAVEVASKAEVNCSAVRLLKWPKAIINAFTDAAGYLNKSKKRRN